MPYNFILWDLDDDPEGNVQHCAEHGVTKEDFEDVLQDSKSRPGVSRTSGRPALFGETRHGWHLIVVYDVIDDDTIYPVSAYDADRSTRL